MDENIQNKLYDDFPLIFKQKDESMQRTCMCWGIECGNGWEKIIRDLCELLSTINKSTGLIVEASQVKEKLGGLRFYVDMKNTDGVENWVIKSVHSLIQDTEHKSYQVCEQCGKFGQYKSDDGWISTLCDKHRNEMKERQKNL